MTAAQLTMLLSHDPVRDRYTEHAPGATPFAAFAGDTLVARRAWVGVDELAGGEVMQLEIPHHESRLAARLHEVAEVHEQSQGELGTLFTAWVPREQRLQMGPFSGRPLVPLQRMPGLSETKSGMSLCGITRTAPAAQLIFT